MQSQYTIVVISAVTGALVSQAIQMSKGIVQWIRHRRELPLIIGSATPVIGAKPGDPKTAIVEFVNGNSGLITDVRYVLSSGTKFCSNPVGPRYVEGGCKVRARISLGDSRDAKSLIICRLPHSRRFLVSDLQRRNKGYSIKKLDPDRDFKKLWKFFYREDLDSLHSVGSTVDIIKP